MENRWISIWDYFRLNGIKVSEPKKEEPKINFIDSSLSETLKNYHRQYELAVEELYKRNPIGIPEVIENKFLSNTAIIMDENKILAMIKQEVGYFILEKPIEWK